eukprot:COSAG01_NODE_52625_length_345_cov_0.845528_2_plen_76_part_01
MGQAPQPPSTTLGDMAQLPASTIMAAPKWQNGPMALLFGAVRARKACAARISKEDDTPATKESEPASPGVTQPPLQ